MPTHEDTFETESQLEPETAPDATASEPEGELAVADPEPEPALEPEPDPAELRERAAKADEYLALAQRTQADFENFRKRMARENAAAQDRGVAKVTKELLPALDHLAHALKAASNQSTSSPDPESGHEDVVKGFAMPVKVNGAVIRPTEEWKTMPAVDSLTVDPNYLVTAKKVQ